MANLFGDAMPTLYANGETTSFQLPVTDNNAKNILFRKITKQWIDFNGVLQERTKGYRLECNFAWSEISATNLDNLIQFLNIPGQKFIWFSSFPQSRKYPFVVDEFEPGLQYGYDDGDSARLSLVGTHLIARLPSLDEFYAVVRLGKILNTS